MARREGTPITYGSSEFQAASELVREMSLRRSEQRDSYGKLIARLLTRPVNAARTARTVARLPTLTVSVSDSPTGRVIRKELNRRALGVPTGRLARACLILPDDGRAYLRGKSRQALRTNLSRARE